MAAAAPACLVRNLPGCSHCAMYRAGTRANGVEPSSRKHAGQVTSLHHGQPAVYVGKAGSALVYGLREGYVGGFAEELHAAGQSVQGFKGDDAERVSQTCMVRIVPAPSGILESSSMAKGADDGRKVESGQGMDDRDICEYMAESVVLVAVEVPACLGAVGGTGTQAGSTNPRGSKRAQAAELMAYLHGERCKRCFNSSNGQYVSIYGLFYAEMLVTYSNLIYMMTAEYC
jgi:hypothetical protein